MTIQMMYELTKTYMVVSGDEIDRTENYRYKMLSANTIKNVLPLEIRNINNEKKIYVDVTGKENVLSYFNCRVADKNEIRKLFDAIYLISEEIARFLIGESDVIMRPEMIFKNLVSGEYEFICIPLVDEGTNINEGMRSLLHFLLMHLDNSNEKLVNCIYTINDMYENSRPKFSQAYEYYVDETKDAYEDEEKEEEPQEIEKPKHSVYIPTLKEIAALVMCVVGIAIIGYNIYLSMLIQR